MSRVKLDPSDPRSTWGEVKCLTCGKITVVRKIRKRKYCSDVCANKNKSKEWLTNQKKALSDFGKDRWENDEAYREKMLSTVNVGGDKNRNWKGDESSYSAKHMWLKNNVGKASKCECCKTVNAKRYEWANLSGEYKRTPDDYMQLCKNCHMALDRSRNIWSALIANQVREARIDELRRVPRINYGSEFAIHIEAYLDSRIAQLRSKE